jgi:SAM-dependent methyltransferase
MTDNQTLNVYDDNVETYRRLVDKLPEVESISQFTGRLSPGALILDLGCGIGNAAAQMRDQGFQLVCVDGSPEMVKAANDAFSLNAITALFSDLDAIALYDGIWANFSLLHAAKADFPTYLKAIHTALKPGGLFFISLKSGKGEKRDQLGRFYAYYQEDELENLLLQIGFTPEHTRRGALRGMAGDVEDWFGVLSWRER